MRRSIFNAGVWTALGLAVAFAIVSANSNTRHAATTAAPAAKATVAAAATPAGDCTSSDACCARESKKAVVAAAPKKATKHVEVAPVAGTAGMVIAIDPETGQLGAPNAEQARQLQSLNLPVEGQATVTTMPDGSLRLNLNGTSVEYATIHVDANGKKVFGCTSNPNAAEMPAPTPAQLEEK